jgi:hypothetical protein
MIEYKLLKKTGINPKSFTKKKTATIINDKYVLKETTNNNQIFSYLEARNFNHIPKSTTISSKYTLYDYIKDYNIPKEERAIELINLISLLHNKTTRYNKTTLDDYKKIYEKYENKIEKLSNYYNDLNEIIDREIYMSPSEYLLARNISKIYSTLNYCKNELENWYELVKDEKKQRITLIHNNLELEHLIRNENSYLISWDKSKFANPIYDLYNFYKKNYDDIEFSSLLEQYQNRYPLKETELKLFFIMISLPEKIDFEKKEYNNCLKVDKLLNYIYKTDTIISPYYPKNQEKQQNNL